MRTPFRRLAPLCLALLGLATLAAPALADALVVVEVRTEDGERVDGEVTLRPRGGGDAFSCTTENGECQIPHVPGGRYTVRFEPSEGDTPTEQPVMIPAEGRVTLHVAAE